MTFIVALFLAVTAGLQSDQQVRVAPTSGVAGHYGT